MVRTTALAARLLQGFLDECSDSLVARKIALDIGLGLGLRNAQLRGQTEGGDSVDDAEVHGLGAVARLLVHGVDGHAEDFAGGEGVNIDVFCIGAHQQRIAAEVRQQAQLDLRVVGGEQLRAGRGGEGGANFAAQLGADGNVLQIRIDRREPAGGRGRGLKRGVHARFGIGQQRQRVDVIRFQLGQMPVFEHQARNFVFLGKKLQHVLRGGNGFVFAAAGRSGQAQMR